MLAVISSEVTLTLMTHIRTNNFNTSLYVHSTFWQIAEIQGVLHPLFHSTCSCWRNQNFFFFHPELLLANLATFLVRSWYLSPKLELPERYPAYQATALTWPQAKRTSILVACASKENLVGHTYHSWPTPPHARHRLLAIPVKTLSSRTEIAAWAPASTPS